MTDIDFLLRQITTEDNKLSFQRLFELYYPALCIYTKRFISDLGNERRYRTGSFFLHLGKS